MRETSDCAGTEAKRDVSATNRPGAAKSEAHDSLLGSKSDGSRKTDGVGESGRKYPAPAVIWTTQMSHESAVRREAREMTSPRGRREQDQTKEIEEAGVRKQGLAGLQAGACRPNLDQERRPEHPQW